MNMAPTSHQEAPLKDCLIPSHEERPIKDGPDQIMDIKCERDGIQDKPTCVI